MSGPVASGRPYWLVLFFVPAAIWLAVFVGFDGVTASLAGACEGALSFLPGCGELDSRQSSVTKVPREFLAASYIVILGATAIALVLSVVMAMIATLGGHAAEKSRERWMFWATIAGIVVLLLALPPKPALRIPSASAVSLLFCLLGGVAALLLYIKLTQVMTRGRQRGGGPGVKPPNVKPPNVPPVVRR
ncbi:MAG: hypothetical protein AB7F36_14465 [Reyranellaceae bacterium]